MDPLSVFSEKRSKAKLVQDLAELQKIVSDLYADGYKKPNGAKLLKYVNEYVDFGLAEA